MKKILIAVPCMDQVPARFAHGLATLTSYGVEDAQISVWFNIGSLIYTSRNNIAKRAIMDEVDLVMWFDSDMIFNPDVLQRMLKHIDAGADMVTGIYYRRVPPYTPTIFEKMAIDEEKQAAVWTEFDEIPTEPFEVDACGFGCVLMKTEVFISVFQQFGNMFAPIGNVGEDIAFCWRARQCGYKILCDPTFDLGHVGSQVITREFFESFQAQKKKEGRGE